MTGTTEKSQGNFLAQLVRRQIFIPLAALLLLIVFNLIADPSFFAITLKENSLGDLVLTGNLITILDNASELVILAIGMTLVTAASGGQDISVGSAIAIAGSDVLRVLSRTNSSAASDVYKRQVRHKFPSGHTAGADHRGISGLLRRLDALRRVQRHARRSL